MPAKRTRKAYVGRVYLGHGKYHWVGRFPTRKARDAAVARARGELVRDRATEGLTCDEWAERFLARYERERKASSTDKTRAALRRFRADFGDRPLDSITRMEAMDWAARVPPSALPVVITLMNAGLDAELIERNPFRGLGRRSTGRSLQPPPSEEEFSRLVDACAVHGWYAPQMRALLVFAAYTGMRPGELFALEWSDIDFTSMRIDVRRRVYKGKLDLPKSNRVRRIALTPPARDALLGLDSRSEGGLVFRSRSGVMMAQPMLSGYWGKVLASAGLDFDFYLATKHYAVHYLYATLGLPPRVIAEQMGWQASSVLKLLATYGHGDVGALEEIDKAFQSDIRRLRVVNPDAGQTQSGASAAP
jgi:integrase